MDQRYYNALGFCQKAGKCQSGDFAAEKTLKAGRAKLILLEEKASQNTREKYEALCAAHKVPLRLIPMVGKPIGKESRIVAAITDKNFANMVLGALASETESGE